MYVLNSKDDTVPSVDNTLEAHENTTGSKDRILKDDKYSKSAI